MNPSATITMPSWTTSGIINDNLTAEAPTTNGEEPMVISGKVLGQEELRKAIGDFILDD
jgi:hypothetical protein